MDVFNRLAVLEAELAKIEARLGDEPEPRVDQPLEAHRFVLLDQKRMQRASLGIAADGTPRLTFYRDGEENGCLSLEVGEDDAPAVVLSDPEGNERLSLRLSEDGEPSVYLRDGSGANLLALRVRDNGRAEVTLCGGLTTRLEIATEPDGPGAVTITKDSTDTLVELRGGGERPAELILGSGLVPRQLELFVTDVDEAWLAAHDFLGRQRLFVGIGPTGDPEVKLLGEEPGQSRTVTLGPTPHEEGEEDNLGSGDGNMAEAEDVSPVGDDEDHENTPDGGIAVNVIYDDDDDDLDADKENTGADAVADVVSLLYPSDFVEAWRIQLGYGKRQVRSFTQRFAFDQHIAVGLMGFATDVSWDNTNRFTGVTTSHSGVAVLLAVVNLGRGDIESLNVSNAKLVDDRGNQYESDGSFLWVDEDGDWAKYDTTLLSGARQEGFLLFPQVRKGARKFSKMVLLENYLVKGAFRQGRWEITFP